MMIGDAIKNSINKFTNEKMKAAFGGLAVYTSKKIYVYSGLFFGVNVTDFLRTLATSDANGFMFTDDCFDTALA